MTTNVVFVGELNPYGADPAFALYHLPRHASGNRLREHLGMTDVDYERVQKVNLCGYRWSATVARAVAGEVISRASAHGGRLVVVTLGAKVRGAFCDHLGWKPPAFFEAASAGPTLTLVALPHPSGMCRLWNAPDARRRARAVLAGVWPEYAAASRNR